MKARNLVASMTLAALLVGGTACGSDGSTPAKSDSSTTVAPTTGIAASDAWARMSPAGVTKGAVYVTLTASQDDALLSASVDPGVAESAEIHEMAPVESDADDMEAAPAATAMSDHGNESMVTNEPTPSSDTTMPGSEMVMMRQVESIPLPAGEAVELKPGGYHIMLIGLAEPLTVGSSIEVTLTFEDAKPMTIDVPVQEG